MWALASIARCCDLVKERICADDALTQLLCAQLLWPTNDRETRAAAAWVLCAVARDGPAPSLRASGATPRVVYATLGALGDAGFKDRHLAAWALWEWVAGVPAAQVLALDCGAFECLVGALDENQPKLAACALWVIGELCAAGPALRTEVAAGRGGVLTRVVEFLGATNTHLQLQACVALCCVVTGHAPAQDAVAAAGALPVLCKCLETHQHAPGDAIAVVGAVLACVKDHSASQKVVGESLPALSVIMNCAYSVQPLLFQASVCLIRALLTRPDTISRFVGLGVINLLSRLCFKAPQLCCEEATIALAAVANDRPGFVYVIHTMGTWRLAVEQLLRGVGEPGPASEVANKLDSAPTVATQAAAVCILLKLVHAAPSVLTQMLDLPAEKFMMMSSTLLCLGSHEFPAAPVRHVAMRLLEALHVPADVIASGLGRSALIETLLRGRSSQRIGSDVQCVVCSDTATEGALDYVYLPCFHRFHVVCVLKWLLLHKTECPQCRTEIYNNLIRSLADECDEYTAPAPPTA
jgi:hypothetical protein